MGRTTWSAIPFLLLALTREASAQQAPQADTFPTAELDYQMAAGLSCPTADELRAEVAKEMRYDALGGAAGVPSGRFHVSVSRGRPGVLLVQMSFDNALADVEQPAAILAILRHLGTSAS